MCDLESAFYSLVEKSKAFEKRIPFPTTSSRVAQIVDSGLASPSLVGRCALETRILVHPKVAQLADDFLELKRVHGSQFEKDVYATMNLESFLYRLIAKRPLVFVGSNDHTLLRDGTKPNPENWLKIGTDEEIESKIKMRDYLTYDEIQISALLCVSSPTPFINSGSKTNVGRVSTKQDYEPFGIIAGLVGARFEKIDKMESQHILVSHLNTEANGYGSSCSDHLKALWAKFYQSNPLGATDGSFYFPTLAELQKLDEERKLPNHYIIHEPITKTKERWYFNTTVYKHRIRIVIETYLMDANTRGEEFNKDVVLAVSGLGLGAWLFKPEQYALYLDAVLEALENVPAPRIKTLALDSRFANQSHSPLIAKQNSVLELRNGNAFLVRTAHGGQLAPKLPPEDQDKLLVTHFPWDGNSFPGNEYWLGNLASSSDPAAACCSSIAELHNTFVNPFLTEAAVTILS